MPTLDFTPLATHFLLNKEMFHFIIGKQQIIYQIFTWKIDIVREGSCPAFELHFYHIESVNMFSQFEPFKSTRC